MFVLEVVQIFITEEVVLLVEILELSEGKLGVCKHKTARWALEYPRVQEAAPRVVAAKNAQGSGQCIARDSTIVRCQCSTTL
jgi:hypothetical protein